MNGIDIEDFINGIADKLKADFPDYIVYDDAIPQNGNVNCFLISTANVMQTRFLGSKRKRVYDFNIAFFPENDSISSFYKWQEIMLLSFDMLAVGGKLYHVQDVEIERVDGVWHFTFAVSFFVVEVSKVDLMKRLTMKGGSVNGK